MDKDGVLAGVVGRLGTAVGVGSGVAVADHSTVVHGALIALAGVAVDLGVRWLRRRFGG